MEEKNLILVCEGQVHTVEYMHKNRVYPKTVVFDCAKFKEIIPYLGKNDDVLVVLNGTTDFSIAMVYSLFRDLDNISSKVHRVTILSNLDLGKIETKYYLYSGDLFYGDVVEMYKGKVVEPVVEGAKDKSIFKNILHKKPKEDIVVVKEPKVNDVMQTFLGYNKNVKLVIHGVGKKEHKQLRDEFIDKIVEVDLFK